MNDKFFALPDEKRIRILNASFRVFSENSYKKSSMSEIAGEAGISKSLLFHYFTNKKELYLFLWDEAARITMELLTRYGCYDSDDLFVMMERGMRAKFRLMADYPHMADFAVRAFYEKDPEISAAIQASYRRFFDLKARSTISRLDPGDFVPGLDLEMMYREMYWASEGYLWEMLQRGPLDPERMERDFERLLRFWKDTYKRRAGDPETGEEGKA